MRSSPALARTTSSNSAGQYPVPGVCSVERIPPLAPISAVKMRIRTAEFPRGEWIVDAETE